MALCYSNDADELIKKTAEEQDVDPEEDDFELVETDDFTNDEEYKVFEQKNMNIEGRKLGLSTYGILEGKILFKSNYFNDKSQTNENSKESKFSDENRREQLGTKMSDELDNKVTLALSEGDTSSEGEQDEMLGTLYFLEHRSIPKNSDAERETLGRRNSAEDGKIDINNPFLQASVGPQKLEVNFFSEEKWRSIYSLIMHKATVLMILSKILNISLPYRILQNGNILY